MYNTYSIWSVLCIKLYIIQNSEFNEFFKKLSIIKYTFSSLKNRQNTPMYKVHSIIPSCIALLHSYCIRLRNSHRYYDSHYSLYKLYLRWLLARLVQHSTRQRRSSLIIKIPRLHNVPPLVTILLKIFPDICWPTYSRAHIFPKINRR